MRESRSKLKQFILFVPLVVGCAALAFLGALFLQGYDSGNALPHTGNAPRFVDVPYDEPMVDSIDIADTSNLPDTMPSVPTPARQSVMHAMTHREQPRPQPARPQPLPPVAEAATSGSTPVNQVVQQAVQQQQQLRQDSQITPAENSTPVPPIPELQNQPIAE